MKTLANPEAVSKNASTAESYERVTSMLMRKVLASAALALGATGLWTAGVSATVFGSQTPSCAGVLFVPVGIDSPVSITFTVGSASSSQTVSSDAPITFLWSNVNVNSSLGGTLIYSFTDTETLTGANAGQTSTQTVGPFTFDASNCTTGTTVPPTTAVSTTIPAPTTTTPAVTTTTSAPISAVKTPSTNTTVPKSNNAGKPVGGVGLASPTAVHTGEPWAGTGNLEVAVLVLGFLSLIGGGRLLRRRRIS